MIPLPWYRRIQAWRDMDSSARRIGFALRLRGGEVYLGRRLYRAIWAER